MTTDTCKKASCDWELCKEKPEVRMKWRRDVGGLNQPPAFDYAEYCLAHAEVAKTNGAVRADP